MGPAIKIVIYPSEKDRQENTNGEVFGEASTDRQYGDLIARLLKRTCGPQECAAYYDGETRITAEQADSLLWYL